MIFIIDDDKEDQELITHAFTGAGNTRRVRFFESSLEFLSFVNGPATEKLLPRYIITDLKMPVMDGIRMVEALRKHPSYQVVPIVMLSTSNLIYDVERAYKAGVNCYLTKPDTVNGWKSTISTVQIWVERWYEAVRV
jgi:CheY-like chemotaxis protein